MSEVPLVLVQVERGCRRECATWVEEALRREEMAQAKKARSSNLFEEQAGVSDLEGRLGCAHLPQRDRNS